MPGIPRLFCMLKNSSQTMKPTKQSTGKYLKPKLSCHILFTQDDSSTVI